MHDDLALLRADVPRFTSERADRRRESIVDPREIPRKFWHSQEVQRSPGRLNEPETFLDRNSVGKSRWNIGRGIAEEPSFADRSINPPTIVLNVRS